MQFIRNSGRRQWRTSPQIALAAAALALLTPSAASEEAIRMSWFTLPPHVFPPESAAAADGTPLPPTGPTIALFDAIAARMGYRVEWVGPIPLSRLDSERETGELKLDGGVMTVKTRTSVKQLLYPARPYFSAVPCLGVRSGDPLRKIASIEDIAGYRIGFVKTGAAVYPPIIADHRDRLVLDELAGEDWTLRNIQKLLEGRIDAVFELNEYSLSYNAAIAGAEGRMRILSLPGAPLDHYFVFNRNSPRAGALVEAYDRAAAGYRFDYDAMLKEELARRRALKSGPSAP
jgi:ABC-type amino acid transport substrate-binding protein